MKSYFRLALLTLTLNFAPFAFAQAPAVQTAPSESPVMVDSPPAETTPAPATGAGSSPALALPAGAEADPGSGEGAKSKPVGKLTGRYGVGVGLVFPDLLPFEGFYFLSKRLAVRSFLSLPIPLGVKLGVPRDEIALDTRLKIGTPASTIDMVVTYGPILGVEGLYFPIKKSKFYVLGGLSYRRIHVTASESTPMFVCFARAEVPCDQDHSEYTTETKVNVDADFVSESIVLRGTVGWFWTFGESGYVNLTAFGLAKPVYTRRKANVDVSLSDAEELDGTNEKLSNGIETVKNRKEASLESKGKAMAARIDQKILPVIGLSVGILL